MQARRLPQDPEKEVNVRVFRYGVPCTADLVLVLVGLRTGFSILRVVRSGQSGSRGRLRIVQDPLILLIHTTRLLKRSSELGEVDPY